MLNTSFSPWPSFTQEEADGVSRVLLSNKVNYWTGQECREFEKEFAAWCGSQKAIALHNGTVAIDLALVASGVKAGDEVVVTPRTFLASASSIVSVGAIPVFADVDKDSQNITAETIAKVLTPKTKAIICVHLAGWPCEMTAINELAKLHGLIVIEDCAQAHGASYKGVSVGSLADAAAWSFCQDKIMTTGGEGGMLTTNNLELWYKAWSYKDHGKDWDAVYNRQHPAGFRWLHESFGTNWRMLEMQGVIGRIQLTRMADWHQARKQNATKILAACAESNALRVPQVPDYIEHAWYRAYAFVKPEKLATGWSRDRIMHEINALGVPCYSGSCSEVYLEKAFDNTGWRPQERLPVAKELGETSLMFLVHPTLTEIEIEKTCSAIKSVMAQAQA
ncbi:MAG TPA: DegT/DnrJ/EryC1/StrS aminotransferase family protein [Agitococcus sp.]|nr:DegT/DnrJ/EryC1/StrS aminotransferase family protein [Agitococcus sp.]